MAAPRYPRPRWQTPLPAGVAGSWGPDVERFARVELGIRLDLAQRRVLNRALVVDAAGRLMHRAYLYSAGRQSSKTTTVRALIGWALTARDLPDWRLLYGIAHDRGQARVPYKLVAADLAPIARRLGPALRGGLNVTRYLGIRSGVAGKPREYHLASRDARNTLRSETIDVGLFDEVRTQRDSETWAALLPATSARPEPLLFLTSTAGDARSVLLRALFDRGLRIIDGAEPANAFGMTWYAADDDDDPADPRTWRKSSPGLIAGRITEATIRAELAGMTAAAFRSERLNLWVDELGDAWLPPGVWARQVAPQPMTPDELAGARIVLAVEAAPTWRRASVVVAMRLADGRAWTGVVADLDAAYLTTATVAPEALVAALATAAEAWRPKLVAYSGTAAAGPHVAAWAAAAGVDAIALTAGHIKQASELLRSELVGARLWHPDDALLAAQARAARPSASVESGGWFLSWRESLGEIDALRAVAWAAWAAIGPPATEVEPQIF